MKQSLIQRVREVLIRLEGEGKKGKQNEFQSETVEHTIFPDENVASVGIDKENRRTGRLYWNFTPETQHQS